MFLFYFSGPLAGAIGERIGYRNTVMTFALLSAIGLVAGSITRHLYILAICIMISGNAIENWLPCQHAVQNIILPLSIPTTPPPH